MGILIEKSASHFSKNHETHCRAFIVVALLACIVAVLGASGCGSQQIIGTSNNDQTAVFQTDDATFIPSPISITSDRVGQEVIIVKSGWWAKDCYIHYGLLVENPNPELIARDVRVIITAYDEKGQVISEDEALISFIGPSSQLGFAGTAGNGQKPASVDIRLAGTSVWQDADGYVEPLFVASVAEEDKGYYRYEYTGGVTNQTGTYVSEVPICILLEDEQGNIIAGYEGSTKRVKEGRTKDYRITINTAPDHAQVEVFAQWSTLNDTVNESLASAD